MTESQRRTQLQMDLLATDLLNGVPGCYRIHRRHDLAVERIPRTLLPERCFTWAQELGVLDALERHWPGTPFDDERGNAASSEGGRS